MKVLLINGSPRKAGNTHIALSEIAKTLTQEGIESEIVWIGNKPVRGCIACAACKRKNDGKCVFDDDICNSISAKFAESDGFIFGSPVYYGQPNGALLRDQRTTSYSERFRFTGKERDTETGYDYFGARYYSSTLPTWLSVDPLSDKYPNVSPYAYCNWNPVIKVDPNGMDEWTLNYKDGQFQYSSNKGGNKTDYYNVGTYEGEKFISHTSFEIERNEGNINVFRIEETTESTISAFHIPNSTQEFNSGFFLERPGPDSDIAGHNLRIPANTYKLHSNMGKNFPNVPRLYLEQEGINGKFDNRGILIHPGNSPINTRGCLLPGSYKRGDYVGNSKNTLKMIQEYIQSKNWNVTLNIFNSLR